MEAGSRTTRHPVDGPTARERIAIRPGMLDHLARQIKLIGLVLLASLGMTGMLLFYTARQIDDVASRQTLQLAGQALSSSLTDIGKTTGDYVLWDDAYRNLLVDFDIDWANENIGPFVQDSLGIALTLVLDEADRIIYRYGGRVSLVGLRTDDPALLALIARARRLPLGGNAAATGIVVFGGEMYEVAVALLQPVTQSGKQEWQAVMDRRRGAVLVFGRAMNDDWVAELSGSYLLKNLHQWPAGAATSTEIRQDSALRIAAADGTPAGLLTWQQDRPGRRFLFNLLPPISILALGIALFGVLVLRRIDAGTRMLHTATQAALAAGISKNEFLANMSHELRTPLNAVLGYSEVIRDQLFGPVPERYRDSAMAIHEAGGHLLEIVNDILDLSKIEVGKYTINDSRVDVAELVAATVRIVEERAGAAGVTLSVALPAALPGLQADALAVKRMLINLLSNAIKFTPKGGAVTLRVRLAPEGGYEFEVEDTGIGIAEKDLERVMEPFVQLDGAYQRRHGGTGLGLPMVKSLAELHGGRFELHSRPATGTRAVIRLPQERTLPA